jgi:hypothetical protein
LSLPVAGSVPASAVPPAPPSTGALLPGALQLPKSLSNGPISGATVFLDANRNGVLDFLDSNRNGIQDEDELSEPSATSYPDGTFALLVPSAFDRNQNGVIDPDEGQLVAIGGIDTTTLLPVTTPLVAPVGIGVVSPLSTIMATLVTEYGYTVADASQRVRDAFNLPDVDLATFNPSAAAAEGSANGPAVIAANARVADAVSMIARLLGGAPGAPPNGYLDQVVYDQLAALIAPPDVALDLAAAGVVQSVINGSLNVTGLDLSDEVVGGAAIIIAASNQYIDQALATGADPLTAIAQAKRVARTATADQLALVAAGNVAVADGVAANTGAALEASIAAAPVGNVLPPELGVTDVEWTETDSGTRDFVFTIVLKQPSVLPVRVHYATGDGEATAADGDYVPTSGDLVWEPGDTSYRTVHVTVNGDTRPEPDESFFLALSDAENAVIRRNFGFGIIRNDDAVSYTPPADGADNDVLVRTRDGTLTVKRNGADVLSGFYTLPGPLTVSGVPGVANSFTVELAGEQPLPGDGLVIVGTGADTLLLGDGAAASVVHRITGASTGVFTVNGSTISYSGLSGVWDDRTVPFSFSPTAPAEDGVVTFQAEVSDPAMLTGSTLTWTITHGADSHDGGSETMCRFTPTVAGEYVVTLTVTTEDGRTGSTVQVITVSAVNKAPLAWDADYTTAEDQAVSGSVTATDEEGDSLTYTVATNPQHGVVALNSDGTFTYTPARDFNGEDSFTFRASDGNLDSAPATVFIMVSPVNDAPTLPSIAGLTLEAGVGEQTVLLSGITAGPADEAGQALIVSAASDNTDLIPTPAVELLPGGSAVLRFTPAAGVGVVTINVTARDDGGTDRGGVDTVQRTFMVTLVDTTPPMTSATLSGTVGNEGWYRSPVIMALAASDLASGVAGIEYRIDGGAWTAYAAPFSLSDGVHTVQYRSADLAGNVETSNSLAVKIDTVAPLATLTPTRPTDHNGWYNHAVSFAVGATDGGSGVVSRTADFSYGGPDSTAASVGAAATDEAGNVGYAAFVFRYDGTAPTVGGSPDRPPNGAGWYNVDVTVHWTVSDALSGIGFAPADSTLVGEGDHLSASASVSDQAGNSATAIVSGIRIDRTAPVTTASATGAAKNASGWFTGQVTVSLSAADQAGLSGVAATYFRGDGGAPQAYTGVLVFTTDGTHTVTFWSVDNAGNVEPASTLTVMIDTTAPTTGPVVSSIMVVPTDPSGPWTVDRFAPAGFTPGQAGGGRVGVVDEFISAADQNGSRPPAYNYDFFDFQGRGLTLPAGTTYVAADLYVPASWMSLTQQDPNGNPSSWGSLASLWATGINGLGNAIAYPVIGFNNQANSGSGGLQVFDQTNRWTNVPGFAGADQWYHLGFGLRAGELDYFVNGQLVYTDVTATGTTAFTTVMLQGYNGGHDYHAYWDNLSTTQDADRAFVLGLYQSLLGRDGSSDAGVNGWVGLLKGGTARTEVATSLVHSAEYQGRLVDQLYQVCLGRAADAAGRAGWVGYLQAGGTGEELAGQLFGSAENQARLADNTAFVKSLYNTVLFRGASDAEVAGWANALGAGVSRQQVAREFLHSQEASGRAVEAIYTTYLHRQADPVGEAGFAGLLQQPDGQAAKAMAAVLASEEYWARYWA